MALLDTRGYGRRQDFLAMEGNEELEEGEARDSNDSNYGPDLNFPHLELKLTEVLGHVRKEFVEGACNDKQGSIYGGYGTFLPTEARAPPAGPPRQSVAALPPSGGGVGGAGGTWGGGWKSPHKQQQQQQHQVVAPTLPGHAVENAAAKRPSALGGRDKTSPVVKRKVASETGGEPKGTNSITLKIKMGSEATSRAKNTAIYNGLGISSSSVSEEEDDDGLSGAETSPERSPASIIQYFLSHKLPGHLVSPLPDLVPEKSIVPRSYAPAVAKEEAGKERGLIKSAKNHKERVKDLADDGGGIKDSELDSRHARQPENDARLRKEKLKGRLREDTFGTDDVARPAVKAPGEAGKSLTAKKPDAEFRTSDAPVAEDNLGKHSKARRDEPALVEAPLVDKRKSKEADSNRPKKKQRPTGSASSFDIDATKPRKGATVPLGAEATFPPHSEATPSRTKPAKESKKDKLVKLSLSKPAAAPELSNTSKKSAPKAGCYTDEVGPSKVKRVKSKLPKKKDIPEVVSKEQPEPAVYGISVVPLEPVPPINPSAEPAPLDSWAQCEKCNRWRLLPSTVTADNLPDKWICKMITWLPGMDDCKFTEQETTEAVQRAYGVLPPLASAVPLEPEVKQPIPLPMSSTAKKGLKVEEPYAEGKKKEKGKKRGVRADDPTAKDSSSERKKKKCQADEAQPSKRMKTEEAQRTKYAAHPDDNDLSRDEDGEVAGYRSAGQSRKQAWKGHESSSSRKDKVDNRKVDRNFDEGGRGRENLEETEVRRAAPEDAKASKSFRVENTKGKAIRIVASGDTDFRNADDWQRTGGNQQQKDEQHTDKRKKRVGSGSPRALSPSESLDGFKERQHHDEAAYDSRKMAPENHTTSATEYGDRFYRKTLARDWEEGEEHDEWEGPQQDAKQVFRHRNCPENNERHRDAGNHHRPQEHRDRGRRSSSEEERIRSREENFHSSRHFKSAKGYHDVEENNKPKVRLKQELTEEQQENLCKYDKKATAAQGSAENTTERRRDKAAELTIKDDNQNLNGTSSDQQGRQNTSKDRRKAVVEHGEGSIEKKENATSLIKHAKSLKHLADRLKDNVIYLHAGLKFMEGAALVERTSCVQPEYESWQLYSDTADLFRYCAGQYERGRDMPGAILAHKCAAVAKFRVVMIKSSVMSRDRTDLLLAMPRVNQPPTGESPSSSSASDLDNLNGGVVGGSICLPSSLQPTLTRFINNTGEMIEAFEHWNKAESTLATLLAANILSPEALATVEKVANIGFSDVEGLVRLVNQALEAQIAFKQQTEGR